MTAKRIKAPANRGKVLHLSQFAFSKRESDRQRKAMAAAGIREIQQTSDGTLWRLRGAGSAAELAAFLAVEAQQVGARK